MIKHVEQYPVSSIFPDGGEKTYKIPKYQREYTWGQKEWDALFNDIVENDEGYFLGSYICVSDSTMNNSSELIDGQQRFSSLSLLMTAIYSSLSEHIEEMDDDEKSDFKNLRKQLANQYKSKDATGRKQYSYTPRLQLQVQNFNNVDYMYVLCEAGIIDHAEKPSYLGVRRINKAYRHFKKCIDSYLEDQMVKDETLTKMDLLFNLADRFNSAVLVGIEVDTHKDAYMLFESLNHRGVPLSAIDLIKNVLIAASEKDNKTDECYDLWKDTIKNIGDDYSVQERFFRQYYNAFRTELNEPFQAADTTKMFPLGYLATRTTLLDIFENLIKYNYYDFINDLNEKSKIYSVIINHSDDVKSYQEELKDLERISGAPSYLLLMYLITNKTMLGIDDANIRTVIKELIKFFVRRSITDVPNTRKLNKLFMDIIDVIRDQSGETVLQSIKKMIVEISASDALFKEKLGGPLYQDNTETTRFILCSIESQNQTREIYTGLWNRDKQNKYIWTIEHIFPEGDNIPNCWIDMIANGDTSKAKEYHATYVHTLGNLTITGYNSALSNMSFDKKMNRTKDGKQVGYRNGLFLNQDVVDKDEWTVDIIKDRTEKIISIVINLFAW